MSPTSAQLQGNYSNLPPGNDIQYYYEYGPCDSFPGNATQSNVTFVADAPVSGQLEPLTALGLFSSALYCYHACVQVSSRKHDGIGCLDLMRDFIAYHSIISHHPPAPDSQPQQDVSVGSDYACGPVAQFNTPSYPPSPYYEPVVDGNLVCTPEFIVTGLEGKGTTRGRRLTGGTAPALAPVSSNPYAAGGAMPVAHGTGTRDYVRMLQGTSVGGTSGEGKSGKWGQTDSVTHATVFHYITYLTNPTELPTPQECYEGRTNGCCTPCYDRRLWWAGLLSHLIQSAHNLPISPYRSQLPTACRTFYAPNEVFLFNFYVVRAWHKKRPLTALALAPFPPPHVCDLHPNASNPTRTHGRKTTSRSAPAAGSARARASCRAPQYTPRARR